MAETIKDHNQVKIDLIYKYMHAYDEDTKFRLTAVKVSDDHGINYGKGKNKDGSEKFFGKQDVVKMIPQMSQDNAHGYNIYITPMQNQNDGVAVRYIFVDDVKRDNLSKAFRLNPSVVLESSKDNFQVLYKINANKDAAMQIFKNLNREMGDPRVSGLQHPTRLPGFSNQKPSRINEDGSHFFVKVIYAENRFSPQLQKQADQIMQQSQQQQDKQQNKQQNKQQDNNYSKNYNYNEKELLQKAQEVYAKKYETYKSQYVADRALAAFLSDKVTREDAINIIKSVANTPEKLIDRHPNTDKYLSYKLAGLTFRNEQQQQQQQEISK